MKVSMRIAIRILAVLCLLAGPARGLELAGAGPTGAGPTGAGPGSIGVAGQEAIRVRKLQSQLMMAALGCGMRDRYNRTVSRFRADFRRHGQVLRRLFRHHYGQAAERELNAWVTRLANEASAAHVANSALFCRGAAARFQALANMPGRYLAVFFSDDTVAAPLARPVAPPR